jgi:hypothetical protein
MRAFIKSGVFAAVVFAAIGASSANATVFCDINPTKDGFVALRAGPSPSARLIAKMRVGDEVQAHGSDSIGKWTHVTWWKGGRFKSGGPTYDPSTGGGWVHESLISDCG